MNSIKLILGLVFVGIAAISCTVNSHKEEIKKTQIPIVGTWKLISGTTIEKGDTVVTDYSGKISFIKIINDTHFAFLKHDVAKGKDSAAQYGSGGGRYSLVDSLYTEHLEYCTGREWEGNDFSFTVTIKNDTLTQSGIEKIESAGINRINIEKYYRLKN